MRTCDSRLRTPKLSQMHKTTDIQTPVTGSCASWLWRFVRPLWAGCPECRYGSHNPPGARHAPTCSLIDHATAKRQLAYYHDAYTQREALWVDNWKEAAKRAADLRHENNTLREKLRKAGIIK